MDDKKFKVGDTVKIKNDVFLSEEFRRYQTGVIIRDNVYHEVLKANVHLVRIDSWQLNKVEHWFTSYELDELDQSPPIRRAGII